MQLVSYKTLMRRTLDNLTYVKANDKNEPTGEGKSPSQVDVPPYAVTQRVNSFLGAFAFAYDHTLKQEQVQVGGVHVFDPVRALPDGWPPFMPSPTIHPYTPQPLDLGEQCRRVRNALAHGSVTFEADGQNEIVNIHLWNNAQQGKGPINWAGALTVNDFETLLRKFCEFIECTYDDGGNVKP